MNNNRKSFTLVSFIIYVLHKFYFVYVRTEDKMTGNVARIS